MGDLPRFGRCSPAAAGRSFDLIARVGAQDEHGGGVGYLQLSGDGTWTLFRQDATMVNTTLASGTTASPLNAWHTVALAARGSTLTAYLDGVMLATTSDTLYLSGNAGLSTTKWNNTQFDNFAVTSM